MKRCLFVLFGVVVALSVLFVSCSSDDGELLTPCEIYITATEGGSVAFEKFPVSLKKFKPGSAVTVVATADDEYEFVGWFVNGDETPVSSEAIYTFIVSEDLTLIAKFFRRFIDGHEVVDLGLSVKWAACNVGATSPEGYGDYFSWGETTGKNDYSWSTYKYCNGSSYTLTKYCTHGGYGAVDNKTSLELADDAAHVNWGGSWRMPTLAELDELRTDCVWTWTTQSGVNGYRVTGPNGNTIFLPAAGYCSGTEVDNRGYSGSCWSSSLEGGFGYNAYYLYFQSNSKHRNFDFRYCGRTIRPVTE